MSYSSPGMSRPVPTRRAVAVLAAGLLPAALAIANVRFGLIALGVDLGAIILCAIDFWLAPHAGELRAGRRMKVILSSGAPNPISIRLDLLGGRTLVGKIRDTPPPGVTSLGHLIPFRLT